MASRKGIVITIIILAAITAGSFLFWMVPQENQMTIVVSDHENYLDGAKEIHSVMDQTISEEFQNLTDGSISPDEYIKTSEVISSQITMQISEFVTSKPPAEWQESYINYIESLKQYNTYIRETIVVATMIDDKIEPSKIEEFITKINQFKENSESYRLKSDDSRP